MKELSIEEKAKAYDEALEKAKDYHKQLLDEDNPEWASEIEKIFPELKESEDEKIRKALISILKSDFEKDTTIYDISVGDIIAWLEKQGEQKPQRIVSAEAKEAMYDKPAWSEEDERNLTATISFLDDFKQKGYENAVECIDWLKSMRPLIRFM